MRTSDVLLTMMIQAAPAHVGSESVRDWRAGRAIGGWGRSRNARWTLQVPQAISSKPTWSNQMLVRQSLQLDTGEGVDSMNRLAAFAPDPVSRW